MKKHKIAKRIGIGLALFLVVGSAAMVIFIGSMIFASTSQMSSNDTVNEENSLSFYGGLGFDYAAFQEKYTMERLEIVSSLDGHTIPANLIYADGKDNDTVILIHGLGGTRWDTFPFAPMFLERGYNVLAYDQRSAGENFAQYTTLGYLESYDTADYVAYLDENIGADKKIHIWGASMGGATACIALSRGIVEDRVASLILDSPIGGMADMFRLNMSNMDIGLPMDFLMFSGNLYNQFALGFSYDDVSPEEALKNSHVPVLIIASKADEPAPFFLSEKLHAAASGSVLASVEDSAHVNIFFDYPEWYQEQIFNFIDNEGK